MSRSLANIPTATGPRHLQGSPPKSFLNANTCFGSAPEPPVKLFLCSPTIVSATSDALP